MYGIPISRPNESIILLETPIQQQRNCIRAQIFDINSTWGDQVSLVDSQSKDPYPAITGLPEPQRNPAAETPKLASHPTDCAMNGYVSGVIKPYSSSLFLFTAEEVQKYCPAPSFSWERRFFFICRCSSGLPHTNSQRRAPALSLTSSTSLSQTYFQPSPPSTDNYVKPHSKHFDTKFSTKFFSWTARFSLLLQPVQGSTRIKTPSSWWFPPLSFCPTAGGDVLPLNGRYGNSEPQDQACQSHRTGARDPPTKPPESCSPRRLRWGHSHHNSL